MIDALLTVAAIVGLVSCGSNLAFEIRDIADGGMIIAFDTYSAIAVNLCGAALALHYLLMAR